MNRTCRKLTRIQKEFIAGRQRYKCANKPGSNIKYLENYLCPLWSGTDEFKGSFDESGYEIDQNYSPDNFQALCISCYNVKINRLYV